MKFQVGDRVRRKSGGPKGTVRAVSFEGRWDYGVEWEDGLDVWGIDECLIEKLPELARVASDGDRVLFAANPALVRIGVRRKARWVAMGDDLGEWWVATVEPMHVPFRNPATRYVAGGSTAAEAVQRALGFARECKLAGVKIGYYHHPQKP